MVLPTGPDDLLGMCTLCVQCAARKIVTVGQQTDVLTYAQYDHPF